MFIELKGVQFENKGAELMLLAILQRLKPEFPQAKFVLVPREGDYEKRAALGLYQKFEGNPGSGGLVEFLFGLVPERYRKRYGIVRNREVSVVLDASGFAYSDQWGLEKTKEAAMAAREWKKQGTTLVLLPQAFGPFTSGLIKREFVSLASCSSLVFPRDSVSYGHVTGLLGESPKIVQSPDFTIGVEGIRPDKPETGRIAIIPNVRMIDKTSSGKSQGYLPFMGRCIRRLAEKGENPFLLVHGGKADLCLAEEINGGCGSKLVIERESDPLRLKGIIGTCKGMIGSRFHALVSALSQGVPALAIGWSHKYEMLFQDFDYPEGILPLETDEPGLLEKLEVFTDPERAANIRERLDAAKKRNLGQVEGMWQKVVELIRLKD